MLKIKIKSLPFFAAWLVVLSLPGIALCQQTLWYKNPAQKWIEALPVGNGSLGAMVFGKVQNEQITLNEDTMWSGHRTDHENPEAGKYLPIVRKMLFNGQYEKAERLVKDKMMGKPVEGHSYQMLGNLLFHFSYSGAKLTHYRRSLDLKRAITGVSFQMNGVKFNRELFSSAVDNSLVMRISSSEKGEISFSTQLKRPKDANIRTDKSGKIVMNGQLTGGNAQMNNEHEGVQYETQLKIKHQGGTLITKGDRLFIKNADQVTLYLVASTDYRGNDPHAVCERRLKQVVDKSYVKIKQDHISNYQHLYNRAVIHLASTDKSTIPTDQRLQVVKNGGTDPNLAELYFNYGRYLLISSSRPGGLAANLQGLWVKGLTPPWNADYHLNINVQMNYWPAEVTNLAECHQPFFALIDSLRRPGHITARNMYNSRGFVAHHATDAWYWTAAVGDPQWGMWPMGVAWSTRQFWEHYLFSQDTTFLKQRAYPVMKEASLFFVDYLVPDPHIGYLVSGPSTSPENTFKTKDGQIAHISMSPTINVEIIHELLTNTIKASQILHLDPALRDTLRNIRKRLRPLKVGDDGRLLEWDKDFEEVDPGHRHISHLFALYPGYQISTQLTPALAKAARKTINYRLKNGGGQTGWSRAWIINYFARLGDGEQAYINLLHLLRHSTLSNLFDTHPPFQIDGNFGGTAGIAEMLIQSQNKEINLLPALPNAWSQGSVKGFRARGGYEINFSWKNKKIVSAYLKVTHSGPCRIRADRKLKVYLKGHPLPERSKEPNVIEFYAKAGNNYTLK